MNKSNLQTMQALFAKDWRFFRLPKLALLAAGVAGYLCALISVHPPSAMNLADAVKFASLLSVIVICLIAAAFGGVAIADERKERASEFLALLPINRRQIMLSKCLVSLFIMAAAVLVHLLIFVVAAVIRSHIEQPELFKLPSGRIWILLPTSFGCTACFFGVGWLFSTFMNSGPVSACLSIGITIALMMLAATTTFQSLFFGLRLDETASAFSYAAVIAFFGICAWIVGTIYYARRIAP